MPEHHYMQELTIVRAFFAWFLTYSEEVESTLVFDEEYYYLRKQSRVSNRTSCDPVRGQHVGTLSSCHYYSVPVINRKWSSVPSNTSNPANILAPQQ